MFLMEERALREEPSVDRALHAEPRVDRALHEEDGEPSVGRALHGRWAKRRSGTS